jgi:hypothetical protein
MTHLSVSFRLSGADKQELLIGRGKLLKEVVEATESRRITLVGKAAFQQGRGKKQASSDSDTERAAEKQPARRFFWEVTS